MHIGIHTRWEILEEKLELREDRRRTIATWQLTRLPEELSKEGPNYLFVAVGGIWQGYFTLRDEILYSPEDRRCPYSLVFDTRSWVEIKPVKTKRFRGFTYQTPSPEEVVAVGGEEVRGSGKTGRVGQVPAGKVGQFQTGNDTIASYSIGAVPILNRFLDESGIGLALEEHLPFDMRYRISPANTVRILILNFLCSRTPLYGVKEWGEQYAPYLLRLEEGQLDSLNDDRMARALDRIFECDHKALVLAAVRSVIDRYQVSLEELHNDSTTIRFYGSYERAAEERFSFGRLIPAITFGFSNHVAKPVMWPDPPISRGFLTMVRDFNT